MTPESKADELVGKFIKFAHAGWNQVKGYDQEDLLKNATQCAIICVEEIIEESNYVARPGIHEQEWMNETLRERQSYWNEVLTHLKNKK